MNRVLILSLLFFAAVVFVDVRPADAGLSRRNPYRSFNVSGYNYGSTQWELSHGKSSWSPKVRSGGFLRRW